MSGRRRINFIVVHCTAGHTNAKAVQDYFTRPKSKGGRGWKRGGYHRIIEKDGTIVEMYDFDKVTNGVKGHNSDTIHVAYVGGVEEDNVRKPKDTRTPEQKKALIKCIEEAKDYCEGDEVGVVGHRDFSPDRNGSGVIESWERIKACPSFDALEEYLEFSSPSKRGILPE